MTAYDELTGSSLRVSPDQFPDPQTDVPLSADPGEAVTVLAGGCFWCVEAVYRQLAGVKGVISGYAGGTAETANYKAVCTGQTDHAEAVKIVYDPSRITFGQLLKVFFSVAHDPTQHNRQGADVGRQYRSAIFYADDRQRDVARRYIDQLNAAGIYTAPIATELEPLKEFYEAENYHQNYAALNPTQPYIAYTAIPKVHKLQKYYADKLAHPG